MDEEEGQIVIVKQCIYGFIASAIDFDILSIVCWLAEYFCEYLPVVFDCTCWGEKSEKWCHCLHTCWRTMKEKCILF